MAFVSAIAAIPADILGLGIASWLLTGAAMAGTLAILLYAVDVITSGDTMFGVSLTQQEFDNLDIRDHPPGTMLLIREEK